MENELFEKAPIPKAYMKMALPVVMGMIVTLIYNLVDTYFIALTGNTDLIAGISLCAPLFTLLLAIGDIFGIGGSSVISRLLGAGEIEDSSKRVLYAFTAQSLLA
jgi:Na+-driven multidrug efflux pump